MLKQTKLTNLLTYPNAPLFVFLFSIHFYLLYSNCPSLSLPTKKSPREPGSIIRRSKGGSMLAANTFSGSMLKANFFPVRMLATNFLTGSMQVTNYQACRVENADRKLRPGGME